ncbi:hypothetical protein QNH48_01725 [Neobacillus sp. YX16]|uniref:hypothetical protein n=1 Tax=Neobacillus sp. YX16 TaxID=3047874 RepID=UPI0024C23421|nr:hypothetical protein [Neobacillus sp. YX16]WHZ03442.1 hypothetical protein QNH48_01725 [Neobacillus sp. YX16]
MEWELEQLSDTGGGGKRGGAGNQSSCLIPVEEEKGVEWELEQLSDTLKEGKREGAVTNKGGAPTFLGGRSLIKMRKYVEVLQRVWEIID